MPCTSAFPLQLRMIIWAAGQKGAKYLPQMLFKENVLNGMTIIPLANKKQFFFVSTG